MSNATQPDRYKRRYERLIEQLNVLGTVDTYENIVFVQRDSTYSEDVMSVIGQEVRKRLRDRIRNARAALR